MSIADCPNYTQCGHSGEAECDADINGIRAISTPTQSREPTAEQILDWAVASADLTPDAAADKFAQLAYQAGQAAAQNNPWRSAVDEALTASGLDCTTPDSDPKQCLDELLKWSTQMALDPSISTEAKALVDRGQAAALEKLRAGGGAVPTWQQIETAPRDGTLILVREERCSGLAVKYLAGWKYESGNICYLDPTHWMPLPPLPKDQTP